LSFYFLEATAFIRLFVQGQGTDALIRLMESADDNRKLISSSTPLEIYAVIRRREKQGDISAEDAASALAVLRMESARMVQQPLNPAVLESARQLLDRTSLRWTEALQVSAAITAREMFQGTEIVFVSTSQRLLDAAAAEGFPVLDPTKEPVGSPSTEAE
jgi:predicted nucleic acid-binding protein